MVVVPRAGDRAVRLVRSVGAALVCTVTAAIGHLAGGGRVPAPAAAACFAGAGVVAWLLSSRRITPGQLVGLLVLCQVCVHLGCSASDMTMSAAMIAMHVLATTVSATVLARGESFVWQLAERLGLRALTAAVAAEPIPCWSLSVPVVTTRTRHDVRLAHSRSQRGPPNGQ